MADKATELAFQNDIIRQLIANGWQLGKLENYNRELALYEEDVLGFVQDTQDAQWQKFCALYPNNPEQKFLERVASRYLRKILEPLFVSTSLCRRSLIMIIRIWKS